MWELIKDAIPDDHAEQSTSESLLTAYLKKAVAPQKVLDVGCGTGESLEMFRELASEARWWGVDIEGSQEVLARKRSGDEFVTFDGVNIPFEDGFFDFAYSRQVLEHVRYPERLLADVARVLKPGSVFIGSTSQLEPYHSRSYWNFTGFGLYTILEDAGFVVKELRPGIDGFTLLMRTFLGRPTQMSRFFDEESPLNTFVQHDARERRPQIVNNRKLALAGHICFVAERKK